MICGGLGDSGFNVNFDSRLWFVFYSLFQWLNLPCFTARVDCGRRIRVRKFAYPIRFLDLRSQKRRFNARLARVALKPVVQRCSAWERGPVRWTKRQNRNLRWKIWISGFCAHPLVFLKSSLFRITDCEIEQQKIFLRGYRPRFQRYMPSSRKKLKIVTKNQFFLLFSYVGQCTKKLTHVPSTTNHALSLYEVENSGTTLKIFGRLSEVLEAHVK